MICGWHHPCEVHALTVALVLAQEIQDDREIRGQLVEEATAISDVFHDLRRLAPTSCLNLPDGEIGQWVDSQPE